MWQLPQVGESGIKEQTGSLGGKEQIQRELQSPENMKKTVTFDDILRVLHVVVAIVPFKTTLSLLKKDALVK